MEIGISMSLTRLYRAAAGFSPDDLNNLALWFSADSGVSTGGSRQYTAANSEYHSIADNAALSTGDIDFTVGAWVYLDTKSSTMGFLAKWNSVTNSREYRIVYVSTDDRFRLQVDSDGTGATSTGNAIANTLGSPSTGKWYFIVAWHDSSANTVNIQINDGAVDSSSHSTGIFGGTADFRFGIGTESTEHMNGRIARSFLIKRVLTSDERTWLYNNGNGRSYGELGEAGTDGASLTDSNLISYWNGNEPSGNLIDAHGANDLTDVNTVTSANGPTSVTASDTSGNDNHGVLTGFSATQELTAWKTDVPAAIGSGYSLEFDGTDDYVKATNLSEAAEFSIAFWINPTTNGTEVITGRSDNSNTSIVYNNPSGNLTIETDSASSTAFSTGLTTGQWQHIAIVRDAANLITVYKNGVSMGSQTVTGTMTLGQIGARNGTSPSLFLDGLLDDVRFYGTNLSTSQVSELVAGNEATGATPTGHWTFDDGPQSSDIADGDPVVTWEDQSTNRYLAQQTTAAARPIYVASGVNSKPVIRFDGVDDFLQCVFGETLAQPNTILLVGKYSALDGFFYDGIGSTNRHAADSEPTNWRIYAGSSLSSSTSANTSAFFLNTAVFDTTNSKLRINGTEIASGNVGSQSLTGLILGSAQGISAFLNGDIAEIIVIDGLASDAEIASTEAYLAAKYGITLA